MRILLSFICFLIGITSATSAEAAPTKPDYVSAIGVAPGQINLIWLGSTVSSGSVTSYAIRRDGVQIATVSHRPYVAPYHDTEQQLYQDMSASPGVTYSYTVTARDSLGGDSIASDAVSASSPSGVPELIPSSRLTSWTPGTSVGVPGGIPTDRTQVIDVTQAPYNADKTGATDASAAINNAIAAAPAGAVVYLPTGTYRLQSTITAYFKSNVTLRGAGMSNTILDCRANVCFFARGSEFYNRPSEAIISGAHLGSNQITVADGSPFTVGTILKMSGANDTALPVISVSGFRGTRSQAVYITAKSGNTITFAPPLMVNFAALQPTVTIPSYVTSKFVGIEDLTVDGTNGLPQFGISFGGNYGSWVKNVKVKGIGNYSLSISESVNCEVRHSFLDELNHSGTNGAGLLMGLSTGCLIEDNTVVRSFPLFEINASSMGNVFAYNYLPDGSVNTNHAPHNSFNLYEGNFLNAGEFKSDGYFGGDSEETFFRNWTTGPFAFKRFSRRFTAVGNVLGSFSLGQPNIGNGSSSGYALASRGVYWQDWSASTGLGIKATLTTRISDTKGIFTVTAGNSRLIDYCVYFSGGNCLSLGVEWAGGIRHGVVQTARAGNTITLENGYGTILPSAGTVVGFWPRSEGFQELDMDVGLTLIRKGNRVGGVIPTNEALPSGQTLPNSLYRSTKPAWFGTLPWPPVDPASPSATTANSIPAGYRYNNPGQDTPGIGSTTTCASFSYSDWGACVNSSQSRNVTGASPSGCTGGTPVTAQPCTPQITPSAPTGFNVQISIRVDPLHRYLHS